MSLRNQLQDIYDKHKKLTPELVVDEAHDPEHPLNDRFDWDNEVAGPKWRRHQAHELIRSVKVSYAQDENSDQPRSIRAYHAVRNNDATAEYTYEPVEKVTADPFLRKLVLRDMEREWKTLYRRYNQFAEFAELVRSDLDNEQTGS